MTHTGAYCNIFVQVENECFADDQCIECFGAAAMGQVNVTAISGCENVQSVCPGYSTLDPVEGTDDTYDFSGVLIFSLAECSTGNIQCQYNYFQAISESDGTYVFMVEPASCLGIVWWAIPIIIIAALIAIGLVALILFIGTLRYLDYLQVKRFEKAVKGCQHTSKSNPVFEAAVKTYENPLHYDS